MFSKEEGRARSGIEFVEIRPTLLGKPVCHALGSPLRRASPFLGMKNPAEAGLNLEWFPVIQDSLRRSPKNPAIPRIEARTNIAH